MVAPFPARPLAKSLIRQLRLKRKSRVLDIGCGNGDLVSLLRRAKIEAYGLYDGLPPGGTDSSDVPDLQPATLHQSIPFLAQSFDVVIVRVTADYDGTLATPEACTATANLLAALKPGGRLLYCGDADDTRMKRHLSQFPGQGKQIMLRTGGLLGFLGRLTGIAHPGLPALQVTIPDQPTSRLEWHRIARKAVARLAQMIAEEYTESSTAIVDSPAA